MPLTDSLRHQVDQLAWYHAIDLGDYQTAGRVSPPLPPNLTLFGVMDLLKDIDVNGLRCMDVGPAHGLISFGLALKGAEVSAINIGAGRGPHIPLIEQILDVRIDYHPGTSLEDARHSFPPATFDLIVCAGVMYHLLNPADAFFRLRPLLKRGGILIVETAFAAEPKEPVLVLNGVGGDLNQPTTYFLPSRSALEGLCRLACFDVLATRVSSPSRFALAGRAVMPDEVNDRSPMTIRMHENGFEDPMFDVTALATAGSSPVRYRGPGGHESIDVMTYTPRFPPHPSVGKPQLGRRFHVPGLTTGCGAANEPTV